MKNCSLTAPPTLLSFTLIGPPASFISSQHLKELSFACTSRYDYDISLLATHFAMNSTVHVKLQQNHVFCRMFLQEIVPLMGRELHQPYSYRPVKENESSRVVEKGVSRDGFVLT
ncbi:hypothetical protein AVEN_179451-1 [Araneus ventricosus]|uniref:Uncharacterized protein n=1 Tax=Araneus ventricosus TaxID=182803 RepID=A0A4Y2BE10_ARAVE|nr:hypothetical protein AVEN_179451-1 [Araneus ventricosus]